MNIFNQYYNTYLNFVNLFNDKNIINVKFYDYESAFIFLNNHITDIINGKFDNIYNIIVQLKNQNIRFVFSYQYNGNIHNIDKVYTIKTLKYMEKKLYELLCNNNIRSIIYISQIIKISRNYGIFGFGNYYELIKIQFPDFYNTYLLN